MMPVLSLSEFIVAAKPSRLETLEIVNRFVNDGIDPIQPKSAIEPFSSLSADQ
jgi:hypothetical protein